MQIRVSLFHQPARRASPGAFLFGLALSLAACGVTVVQDPFADGSGQGARVSKAVDGSKDVELTLDNGAKLQIPEGAVSSTTPVELERMADERASKLIDDAEPRVRAIGAPHLLTPHGTQFERAVQLTLPLAVQPRSRSQLRVVWLEDESDRKWKRLEDVELGDGMVTVQLHHFSVVMVAEVDPGLELDTAPDSLEGDAAVEREDAAVEASTASDAAAALDAAESDAAAPQDASSVDARADAASTAPGPTWEGTLIKQLGSSAADFIVQPHTIRLVSAESGEPVDPPVSVVTSSFGGFRLQAPDQREYWLQVAGHGPATNADSTYDSLTLWAPRSWDLLLRMGTVGTAAVYEVTGAFNARLDAVPLQGTVYRVDSSGKRVGTVGCATIFIDDLPSPATSVDQRYVKGVLPGTLAQQSRTERSGKWFVGNLSPGLHTFKASVDNGATFLAAKTVYVPFARKDALGDFKAMMLFMGIDVPGPDPTPANCPDDP